MRGHGKSAKRFPSAVAVVSVGSFIQIEDAQLKLQVYCGEFFREKLPGVPNEVGAEKQDAFNHCDLGDGNWAMVDFAITPWGRCR